MLKSSQNSAHPSFSLKWYEKLLDVSPVGIFFTDIEGNCLEVNQRWSQIAGMSREKALGRGWIKAIYENDLNYIAQKWYEAAGKKEFFCEEYRFCTPEGQVTWVLGEAKPVFSDEGAVEGYIGCVTDITASKISYSQISQTYDRARTILQEMPIMLFAFDTQGKLCAWNTESERITGYSAEELIGADNVMELLCPDKSYRQEMLRLYKEKGDSYINWEWKITTKDGVIKTISFSNISEKYPIDGWANWGVGFDLTPLNDSESKLRERIKELTCLYKLSILSNQHNLNLEQLLDEVVQILPPSWQYPENTCARIIFEDQFFTTDLFKVTPWKLSSELHVRGKKIGLVEVYYLNEKPQEAEGPFLIEERLLIDEVALQLSRTIGHFYARRDLSLMEELAAKSNELERFSHSISHDLRTPLTAIGGFAQFLKKQIVKGNYADAETIAQKIADITTRMENRLNEILKLAKIGKIINPEDEIDFEEIIDDTLNLLANRLEDSSIDVKIEGPFPKIIGDRTRLIEVLENLVDNAIKYIGTAPNQITIGCRREDDKPVFYVMDNGIGIDTEHFEHIFELFWRLDSNAGGDGTGLAITRRIIEAHGGKIWVESGGQGKGACFCFTFGHVTAE